MHRFFIPPEWIQGKTVMLGDAVARQIGAVLRMRPGDRIVVLDNQGFAYEVELDEVGKRESLGTVVRQFAAGGEPSIKLTLYQCVLKKDNVEWVLQKGTEIGVTAFVPVISRRSVITEVKPNKHERWERIIAEAAEQSRRGALPELHAPLSFAEAVQHAADLDLAVIPWEDEHTRGLRSVLEPFRGAAAWDHALSVAVFIGPEGGFEPEEIALAEENGVRPVSLGPRILRAETAAVAAAMLVIYELDTGWQQGTV